MKLYSVVKRRGQWAVCSQQVIVLILTSYDEAIRTAQTAVQILPCKSSLRQSDLREWTAELGGNRPVAPLSRAEAQLVKRAT